MNTLFLESYEIKQKRTLQYNVQSVSFKINLKFNYRSNFNDNQCKGCIQLIKNGIIHYLAQQNTLLHISVCALLNITVHKTVVNRI